MQHPKRLFLYFSVLSAIYYESIAQLFQMGGCENKKGVPYVDYEKFKGVWYEFGRTPRAAEDNSKCNVFIYQSPDEDKVQGQRMQVDNIFFSDVQKSKDATLTPGDGGKGVNRDNYDYNFLVLDYDDLAVVYACQNLLFAKNEIAWILTRKPEPSCETILKAYDTFCHHGISLDQLQKSNQTNCPQSWEPSSNVAENVFGARG